MDSNVTYSNLVAMELEFSSFGHCFEHISSSTFYNFWENSSFLIHLVIKTMDRQLQLYRIGFSLKNEQ